MFDMLCQDCSGRHQRSRVQPELPYGCRGESALVALFWLPANSSAEREDLSGGWCSLEAIFASK